MGIRVDLSGKKFGRLAVVSLHSTGVKTYWNCVCECGNETKVESWSLQHDSRSCGCLREEVQKSRAVTIAPGTRYGRLVMVRELERVTLPSGQKNRVYLCRCDCGNESRVRHLHLIRNRILSCGCNSGEKHGLQHTKIYSVWSSMKQRCHAPYVNKASIDSYQKRGIVVCAEWQKSFTAFYNWAMANGYKEGLEIDRKDNDSGYSPSNCRWVTREVNMSNTRQNVFISAFGRRLTITQWARETGIAISTIQNRLKLLKWPPEKCVSVAARRRISKEEI